MRESVRDGTGCMVLEGLLGFLNAILSVTVFAAPYWRQTSYNDPNGVLVFHYSGLWQNCSAATCTIIPMAAPGETSVVIVLPGAGVCRVARKMS